LSFSGYIAIEGPIGVGKTELAELIAERLKGEMVYELAEDNPFLPEFYRHPDRSAFQTQIFFLMSRFNQLRRLNNRDLFSGSVISDYLFAKDRIFAGINLSEQEYSLYDRVASALESEIARPDLVIYLTAAIDTLTARIKKRGREFEKGMDRGYLKTISESYSEFFFHYTDTPLLVVKTDDVDFSKEQGNFEYLLEKIISPPRGTEYIAFDRLKFEET